MTPKVSSGLHMHAHICSHAFTHTHTNYKTVKYIPPPTYRRKGKEVISTSRKFQLKVREQTCAVQLSRLLKWHRPGHVRLGCGTM